MRLLVTAGLVAALALGGTTAALGAEAHGASVSNTAAPRVTGEARFGSVLVADPGTWEPSDATYTYQWLRDGTQISGADGRRYRPAQRDIDHDLAVVVTASAAGFTDGVATSDAARVAQGVLEPDKRPTIGGERRFGHTLVARPGTWSSKPARVRYQWLRNGEPVKGAHSRRYPLGLADFGEQMSVQVTATKQGYHSARSTSATTERIGHRVPVRHVVRYHVETRGRITADLAVFKQQAQETFDDPRGWRGSGVELRRVARGGGITLVLSEASQVPSFSSGCSAQWSCRVGRFVIINQTRWRNASPMWNQVGRSLRDYRHMVVNHETGHWLGWGHRSCPGRGSPAPVMQQQSKGLEGCRANPWPTAAERRVPRFG